MLLMIDNYDSFTYNLVHYLGTLGVEVLVKRNNQITLDEIQKLAPDKIIISPGPGNPDEAGITLKLIQHFAGKIPILGVCLGHQAIGQVFGARIIQAKKIMHGKTSLIHHQESGIFANLPTPFTATRYHSLIIDKNTLPACLEITAWTQNEKNSIDDIMGIQHREFPLKGVQFHPESIQTEYGYELLENFLQFPTTKL